MKINKKYILTYCSNIFKVNKVKKLIYNINQYIINIKKKEQYINISLCISNNLSIELKKKCIELKSWMKKYNIDISSINAFVYQNFHKKRIKETIYSPDWSSINRLIFTHRLITLSSKLKRKKIHISISTLPISYKKWIKKYDEPYIFYKSTNYLKNYKISLNKNISIDIEPEPCCEIENYKNFIIFYKKWIDIKKDKSNNAKFLGICFDVCHFSVIFDKQEKIIKLIKKTKINIGKIQISSALKTIIPKKISQLKRLKNTLHILRKSDFLHQCMIKNINKIEKYTDIPKLLSLIKKKQNLELRIHCHIPVYKKKFKYMTTTKNEINKINKLLKKTQLTKILEIETYTQNIFFNKINRNKSIKKEYHFTIKSIKK